MTQFRSEVLELAAGLQEHAVCPLCGSQRIWVATPVALTELNVFCADGKHQWSHAIRRNANGGPYLGPVRVEGA